MSKHGHIAMTEAASRLLGPNRAHTDSEARQFLIATLIAGEMTAVCDAYWRESIPEADPMAGNAPWDTVLPADFWHLHHADNILRPNSYCPTGHWGDWSEGNFQSSFALSGVQAALRYADFAKLRRLGSNVAEIRFSALGVEVHSVDLDRLIKRGRPAMKRTLEKIRQGAGEKSRRVLREEHLALLGRVVAVSLPSTDRVAIMNDPKAWLDVVQNFADTQAEDAAGRDRLMRDFALHLVAEAAKLEGIPPGN